MNFFLVKSYFKYLFKAGHYKGHGIHSPFVFDLVTKVLGGKHSYYAFSQIEDYRKELKTSNEIVEVIDFGAGSHVMKNSNRKVSDIYKNSAIRKKHGEILFRLINSYRSKTIVELGTSLGVSTIYLALPNRQNRVYTIEGCPKTAGMAAKIFGRLGVANVTSLTGKFYDLLPNVLGKIDSLDFLFIDGHHEYGATVDYFRMCKVKAGNNSIFVFDDIHWSEGMERAWGEICNDPDVTISIDLFQLGVAFFRKECRKQHFVVRM